MPCDLLLQFLAAPDATLDDLAKGPLDNRHSAGT
jgi:hypothetical protein